MERVQHLMRSRGMGYEEVLFATRGDEKVYDTSLIDLIGTAAASKRAVGTPAFLAAAEAHKRCKEDR